MKDGFVSVAAITPDVRVADVDFNVAAIVASVKAACKKGAKIVVTPELGVTGRRLPRPLVSPLTPSCSSERRSA